METIGTIIACLVAGYLLKSCKILKKNDTSTLNKLIIYFFIPILSLLYIPTLSLTIDLLWLTISPFLVFLFGLLTFNILRFSDVLTFDGYKALTLTCGISSTSFVGFPIFELLYGEAGLAYGVFLSLGGTILVFNTLGMLYLIKFSSDTHQGIVEHLKKLFSFFPFLIFIFATVINILELNYPDPLNNLLRILASPFTIVALIAIGAQIEMNSIKKFRSEIMIGIIYKLILAPFLIFVLMWFLLGKTDLLSKICILGAGIGSMNAMSVLAAEKGIKPELSIVMPAISIPLSVFTLFVIDYLLK